MKNMKLTSAGARLLGTAHADGESRYWIGYYGLAYVADRENDTITDAAQSGVLTKHGDYIYNIWQGDMLNGYAQSNPDDTAAASLFGLTLYDKSIRTNYRYVYDAISNRNRLVAWKSVSNGSGENTLERKGVAIYYGTDGNADSEIPLPAPLYYSGDPSDNSVDVSSDPDTVVHVSSDYRYYVGTSGDSEYGWKASTDTQTDEHIVTDAELLGSISNFNKFHGTVSSEGYGVSSVSSCHNMSRATKLFPISYYNVINDNGKKLAETEYNGNSGARKPLATSIKFSIDLSPVTADAGYTALNYEDGGESDDQDSASNRAIYESKYVSFKFNRVGIYAVPMTVHRYSTDSATEECSMNKVQFEIDGDAEPVLFAIADVNDTIISDNPSSDECGVAKFTLDFILNIGNGDEESSIEQRTAVYYNLYESDAATWYKNQLLASASISEAVTDLSLEMNAIKQHVSDSRDCGNTGIEMAKYALKNHTHDYLKNLVDGEDNYGSVRGLFTCEEGDGSNIRSTFGLFENAPSGAQKSCELPAISGMVDGTSVSIPDSYLYCLGAVGVTEVPSTGNLSYEELTVLVNTKGAYWIASNLATNSGWYAGDSDTPNDTGYLYIWLSAFKYAKVNKETNEIIVNSVNAGGTDRYLAIVISTAVREEMFANGYTVGSCTVVLGDNTAASGNYSIVQGNNVYSNSNYLTALGSDYLKVSDSHHVSTLGASGFNVSETDYSIVFGKGNGNVNAGYDRPAELKNVEYSIIGGKFYDSGSGLFGNGISGSLWLMQEQGMHQYGAEGTIAGSLISGNAMVGASDDGVSARNSVILRHSEAVDFHVRGPVVDSMVLGEGYAYQYGAGHDETLDRRISVLATLNLKGNLHNYLTESEQTWCAFKDRVIGVPSTEYSIHIGANICKKVSGSIVMSDSGMDIAPFSINTRVGNQGEGVFGATRSVLVGGNFVAGERIDSVIGVGGGNLVPDNSRALVMVGNSNCGIFYDDEVATPTEFNRMCLDGTLKKSTHYTILGSGTIKVSNGIGGYTDVELSGEDDQVYVGVYVDNTGTVTYNPIHESSMTVGTMVRTVSLGKERYTRINPKQLSSSLVIGDTNDLHSVSTSGLTMVGNGNSVSLMNLSNVSIFGDGVHLDGSDAHAYGNRNGVPAYATVKDVHVFGSGLNTKLNSVDPFATHTLANAVVNLTGDYDMAILGIYDHPVYYTSMPNDGDTITTTTWNINYSDPDKSLFNIDPNMFSNFKDAWVEIDPTSGLNTWYAYNPTVSKTDNRWSAVTKRAEELQSDDDEYRGYDIYQSYGDPFKGMKRSEIRDIIGKPKAPMLYTGGIALAGFPTGEGDKNFGLIKMGHVSKPVAYINSNPVSGWAPGSELLHPVSITGTTNCPYAGMSLAIDWRQEIDGTMHLVLNKNNTGNFFVENDDYQAVTDEQVTVYLAGGLGYILGAPGTGHQIILSPNYMKVGDICALQVNAFHLVKVYVNDLFMPTNMSIDARELPKGTYLVRAVSYKPEGEDSVCQTKLIIQEIKELEAWV